MDACEIPYFQSLSCSIWQRLLGLLVLLVICKHLDCAQPVTDSSYSFMFIHVVFLLLLGRTETSELCYFVELGDIASFFPILFLKRLELKQVLKIETSRYSTHYTRTPADVAADSCARLPS